MIYVRDGIDIIINTYFKTARIYDLKSHEEYNLSWTLILYLLLVDCGEEPKLKTTEKEQLASGIKALYDNKILTKTGSNKLSNIVRYELKKPLEKVQIEITNKCNFNCKHCFNTQYRDNTLPLTMIKKIVDECKRLAVRKICLTGGEPFTHKNIKEIINYISLCNMQCEIYTNGYFLNEEMISFLKAKNVANIRLSLDGISKEIHDSFRGCRGSFDKVIEAAKLLKHYNIPFEINTMIHKGNSSIIDVEHFVKNTIGNVHVVHDYVLNMGNAVSNYKDIGLDIDQYSNACVEHYKKQLEAGLSFDTKAKHFCGIGNNFLYITAKGLLKICPSVRDEYNIGNIFENSIENCWNSEQAEYYENIQCERYTLCPYKDICKGGCRSRGALLNNGHKLTSPDTVFCDIFSKLFAV